MHLKPTTAPASKKSVAGKKVDSGKGVADGFGKLKVALDTKGKWMASIAIEGHLKHLTDLGYLSLLGVADCHSPVMMNKDGEEVAKAIPHPRDDEWVCFVPFLLCGLGFPIHPFFQGLLHFYGFKSTNSLQTELFTLPASWPCVSYSSALSCTSVSGTDTSR